MSNRQVEAEPSSEGFNNLNVKNNQSRSVSPNIRPDVSYIEKIDEEGNHFDESQANIFNTINEVDRKDNDSLDNSNQEKSQFSNTNLDTIEDPNKSNIDFDKNKTLKKSNLIVDQGLKDANEMATIFEKMKPKKKEETFFTHQVQDKEFAKQVIDSYLPTLFEYIRAFKYVYLQCYQGTVKEKEGLAKIMHFFRKVKIQFSYQKIEQLYYEISDWMQKFDLAEERLLEMLKYENFLPCENEFEEFSFVKFLCLICMICHCCYSPFKIIESEGIGFLIMNIRELQEYLTLFSPLDSNTFKNHRFMRNSELREYFQKEYELESTTKKNSTIMHKNEFMMEYAKSFSKKEKKNKEKPQLDELITIYQKEQLFVYITNLNYSPGCAKMQNHSLTCMCEEAIIKVSLGNSDSRSIIKRCPKRRAKIDIILSSIKDTRNNKVSQFLEAVNQVAKGMYKYDADRHNFIKNLFDNAQNKITKIKRITLPTFNFIKDQENIDMMSLLKDSFNNLVHKNFKNKDEIYLKEILELLTNLSFIPAYVAIQKVTEIFIGFLQEKIEKADNEELLKLIENDEFGLNYNSTLGLFIHFAIEFNLNNTKLQKERVKWFFCKVFAKGENMKI